MSAFVVMIIIMGLIAYVVFSIKNDFKYKNMFRICTNCGYEGKAKFKTKGSFLIEIVLWLFFIIPGLIYSLWRMSASKMMVCPECDNINTMIPADSPRAVNGIKSNLIKCPYCAELIKPEAKICRFCGRNVNEQEAVIDL